MPDGLRARAPKVRSVRPMVVADAKRSIWRKCRKIFMDRFGCSVLRGVEPMANSLGRGSVCIVYSS